MDPALAALLGTALGGLISYLAAVHQQNRQHRRERENLLLAKVEETYQAGVEVRDGYRVAWGEMTGRLALGQFGGVENLKKIEIDRVRMLVELYFPTLEASLKSLEAAAEVFSDAIGNAVSSIDQPECVRVRFQRPLFDGFDGVDEACVQFLKEVGQMAGKFVKREQPNYD